MMVINKASDDTQGAFLQIKQDDRFFSRLLSRETTSTITAPSFRVLYYGGETVNVPFTWEIKPGTPKHYTLDQHHRHGDPTMIPPLTPPPSYCTNKLMPTKRSGRCNSFLNLLPKIIPRKPWLSSSSSRSSFSSELSSSQSSWKSTSTTRSAVQFHKGMEDVKIRPSSPTSTLCFGINGLRFDKKKRK